MGCSATKNSFEDNSKTLIEKEVSKLNIQIKEKLGKSRSSVTFHGF